MIELKAGMRFGRLTTHKKSVRSFWVCYCDCGSIREASAASLWAGTTRSCGCLKRDISGDRMLDYSGDASKFRSNK